MSHHAVPTGSLSALLIVSKMSWCSLGAECPQQHPGPSFPALPCWVTDHIPAATKVKHRSPSSIVQANQGLSKCRASVPTARDVPPQPPPIHILLPLAATPASREAEDKSPGCVSAKQTISPHHFLKEQTKLEGRAWQASCFLSGALELGERRCILMASGWTEIRILVAEAILALL